MLPVSQKTTNHATENDKIDENSTISHCKLDFEEGFTSIPNALIRNEKLSPNCRWLIIYLLSNRSDWIIKVKQILKHLNGMIGKDAFYIILNEALESGYLKREDKYKGNLRYVHYEVSHQPRFKKCFRHPENQDPGTQDPEKPDDKEILYPSKEGLKNKQKKEPSAEASSLASLFYEKLQEINPLIKPVNLKNWALEFEGHLKNEKYSLSDIHKVIDFLVKDDKETESTFSWGRVIQSPKKFFLKFPQIWKDMKVKEGIKAKKNGQINDIVEIEEIEKRRALVKSMRRKFWPQILEKEIQFDDKVSYACVGKDNIYYTDLKFYDLLKHSSNKIFK